MTSESESENDVILNSIHNNFKPLNAFDPVIRRIPITKANLDSDIESCNGHDATNEDSFGNNDSYSNLIGDDIAKDTVQITDEYRTELINEEMTWSDYRVIIRTEMIKLLNYTTITCATCGEDCDFRCQDCTYTFCKRCLKLSHAQIYCHRIQRWNMERGWCDAYFAERNLGGCSDSSHRSSPFRIVLIGFYSIHRPE